MPLASIRINETNQAFVDQYIAIHQKANKSALVNKALELFRKYCLQKELIESVMADEDGDRELADVDFKDYLKIVDEF